MRYIREISINRKLAFIAMSTVGVVLVLTSILEQFNDFYKLRQSTVDTLSDSLQIVAINSIPSIVSNDPDAAKNVLSALKIYEHVVGAEIYTADRKRFAFYARNGQPPVSDMPQYNENRKHTGSRLDLFHPIMYNGKQIGTIHAEVNMSYLHKIIVHDAIVDDLLILIVLTVAFFITLRLNRFISNPISNLVHTAETVATTKDYSVRAEKYGNDELGLLADVFNRMLGEIEKRDVALRDARHKLDEKVAARTKALRDDIRERQKIEKALRASEKQYRELFNRMISGFALNEIVCDDAGTPIDYTILEVNRSFETMMSCSAEQVVGKQALDVFPYTDPSWIATFGTVALTGQPARFESYVEELDKHFEVIVYRSEKGLFATVISDISARKQAEEELTRLATAVEQAAEEIVITDTEGIIEYVNPAFERITGYTAAEAIGQKTSIVKSGEHDTAFYDDLWDTIKAGKVWTGRFVDRRKDGTFYTEEATITPVMDSNGEIVNFVGVKRDVTEQLALEGQLQQAHKMEAIGLLAGGVAHDFNNLLTGIIGYANVLKSRFQPNDETYKAADLIEFAGKRAAQLTEQLLGFARKGKHENTQIDLNKTIREVVDLLGRTINKNIDIKLHFRTANANVLGDPNQLQQVLLNLAINSRDAMPDGGELTFETDHADLDEIFCQSHPGTVPGRYVVVSVSDTGSGIPEGIRARVFEPFFTTKEQGKGTGMGLAMVYGIVKNHGGSIWIYSEPDKGTTVKVYLPLCDFSESGNPDETKSDPIKHGSGRILLVDDEEVVRTVAAMMLNELGYEVIEASNGRIAVDLFRDRHSEIDLVIIDMNMPEMGGRECYMALKEIDPEVRAILSTGYSIDGAAQDILDLGINAFIQKPYVLSEISEVVDEVLGTQKN